MVVRITTKMLFAADRGGVTHESVAAVRRIFAEAGIGDVELHALEVERLIKLCEQVRATQASIDRILASGPLPEHTCRTGPEWEVLEANDCPVGCSANRARIEVPYA